MDLYEAIDIVSEYLEHVKIVGRAFTTAPTAEELYAIEICLEAARDKAGV